MSLMKLDTKILNKIFANQIQQCMKRIIYYVCIHHVMQSGVYSGCARLGQCLKINEICYINMLREKTYDHTN